MRKKFGRKLKMKARVLKRLVVVGSLPPMNSPTPESMAEVMTGLNSGCDLAHRLRALAITGLIDGGIALAA